MKIGILTFQFAHNYGAMLQAYALKTYLLSNDYDVHIVPYYPEWAQKEYAISPFAKNISYRKRVRFALQYLRRRKVASKFDDFLKAALTAEDAFTTEREMVEYLNKCDYAIFGSDQIWNDAITGRSADYYGASTVCKRISYAASLGTKELSEWQYDCAERYLTKFSAISVREPGSKILLEEVIDNQITTVLDPVFLISEESWASECSPVNIDKEFILLYLLREDEKLLYAAKKYAKEKGLRIYEIHPTLSRFHAGCQKLIDVGPREFLWLIKNAQCVCTNSFHATSFGMIFAKKLLHIPNINSPERTTSLLERMGYSIVQDEAVLPLYDLSNRDKTRLELLAADSKRFISDSLEGMK